MAAEPEIRFFFDSRGRNVNPVVPGAHVKTRAICGAQVNSIYHIAKNEQENFGVPYVTILAGGINNLTAFYKGWTPRGNGRLKKHRELGHNFNVDLDDLVSECRRIQRDLIQDDSVVLWCTVAPCNLQMYNTFQGNCPQQFSPHQCALMQAEHERVVAEFNHALIGLNRQAYGDVHSNNGHPCPTPFLHRDVLRDKGRLKASYAYWRLYDGLHPNEELRQKWAAYLGQFVTSHMMGS